MPKGTVKWFNVKQGFGFIVSPDSAVDVFVHQEDIQMEGFRTLEPDEVVMFEFSPDDPRGARARSIVPLGIRVSKVSRKSESSMNATEAMESFPEIIEQQSTETPPVDSAASHEEENVESEAPVLRGKKKRAKEQRRSRKEHADFI